MAQPLAILVAALVAAVLGGVAPADGDCLNVEEGFNYMGNDIHSGWPAATAAECCARCTADPACLFYTFNPNVRCTASGPMGCCHPKSSKAGREAAPGRTSGQSHNTAAPTPAPSPAPPGARNILFIVADDLRPNLNVAYGQRQMLTPNLDALARESLIFTHAFVQQQVCSPSRNSFMTGRRPDRTMVQNFITNFRDLKTHWLSMPEYFKVHGYQSRGSGKLFHPNQPPNNDLPFSWTSYDDGQPGNMSCNNGKPKFANVQNTTTGEGSQWRRIIDCEENDSEAQLTQASIEHIRLATNGSDPRPFFIGMGHHRPHLPWNSPARFIEQYGDPRQLPLATNRTFPVGTPSMAFHPWFDQVFKTDEEPALLQHYLRRGYYGAVSYFDYHLGQLLQALKDAGQWNNTAIFLTGDHGWALGEHNGWEKKNLFELDCKVPLLIRVPWIANATKGLRTTAMAELVDLMPTMIEVAGLPAAKSENLQGVSQVPNLISAPQGGPGVKEYAFSQFPRCNCTYEYNILDTLNGTCPQLYNNNYTHETGSTGAANHHVCLFTPMTDFDWQGYSIRDLRWRFTMWVAWNKQTLRPDWSNVWGEELCLSEDDHEGDDATDFDAWENENLAVHPNTEQQAAIARLRPALIAQFNSDS